MCDTINTIQPVINSPIKVRGIICENEPLKKEAKIKTKEDICEPDNGHKTESINSKLNLQMESERLKTFKNWKSEAVTPETLAKAGFYYLNRGDLVKCAFCNAEICEWEAGDNPMDDHTKWAPNCPFVNDVNNKSNNRQKRSLPQQLLAASTAGQDTCGNREFFPNSMPDDENFKLLRKITKPCRYEQYDTYEGRLKSFAQWPKSLRQKPTKLAEAGFFYIGVGDQTLCFHCGGGLKDWEDNDDPWEQHALWFSKCDFLVTSKGEGFIEEVKNKLKPETESVPCSTSSTKEETIECNNKQVAENNTILDDSTKLCKICYKNELEVVFIPCGHLVACVECSFSLKNICPVCRKKFDATFRTFLS